MASSFVKETKVPRPIDDDDLIEIMTTNENKDADTEKDEDEGKGRF